MFRLLLLFVSAALAIGVANPLPSDLPILELRYPDTPWIYPGDTLEMSSQLPNPLQRVRTNHDRHLPLPQISSWGLPPNSTSLCRSRRYTRDVSCHPTLAPAGHGDSRSQALAETWDAESKER